MAGNGSSELVAVKLMEADLSTYACRVIKPSKDKVLAPFDKDGAAHIMFSVDFIHIHEFVIYILDALMNGRGMRGILVTVDRPANYIVKLMKARNLNLERIKVIDMKN